MAPQQLYESPTTEDDPVSLVLTGDLDMTLPLAEDGFCVVRLARQDNSDGTYTWTYIVERE